MARVVCVECGETFIDVHDSGDSGTCPTCRVESGEFDHELDD